eukprot:4874533-Amphidinium_carterae.1
MPALGTTLACTLLSSSPAATNVPQQAKWLTLGSVHGALAPAGTFTAPPIPPEHAEAFLFLPLPLT